MPFNQLILPLLGGYVFVNHTYLTSYWSSRHSREHLIFLAAVAGAALLLIARLIAWGLADFWVGRELAVEIHRAAPFNGIGTAFCAFFLGFAFRAWVNRAWNKEKAPLWHYAKGSFNRMEQLFFSTFLDVAPDGYFAKHPWRVLLKGLFGWYRIQIFFPRAWARLRGRTSTRRSGLEFKEREPQPVMLFMKNRKVYVGYILFVMPVRAETTSYITIIPAWSGYRRAGNLKVEATENYSSTIASLQKAVPVENFAKVICLCDIEAASLYNDEAFAEFASHSPVDTPTDQLNGGS